MKYKWNLLIAFTSLGLLSATFSSSPAQAAERRGRHEESRRDDHWGSGHWTHDRHDGRLGWWWVIGPTWHYYDRPYRDERTTRTIIIEQPPQQPPVTVVQPAPPASTTVSQVPVLYYCRATGTYYPDTMSCPGGWSTSVAGAPPTP